MQNQEIFNGLVQQMENLGEEIMSVILRDDDNDTEEAEDLMFDLQVLLAKFRDLKIK
jgi:phosphoribosyl-ATP pyrophosphohydrolase